MDYRAYGFNQRRPTAPGIYLISCIKGRMHKNIRDGWDVAQIYFANFDHRDDLYDRREGGVWRVKSLAGVEYVWRKGMWLKGPITPALQLESPPERTE